MLTRLTAFDADGDGLLEHAGRPDQTYDTWPMHGPSAYGGSLWLAAIARRSGWPGVWATTRRRRPLGGLVRARPGPFDRRLWRGDHYAYDDGDGPSSDSIMADQLAGQWYADATGLGDIAPPDQVSRPCGRSTG